MNYISLYCFETILWASNLLLHYHHVSPFLLRTSRKTEKTCDVLLIVGFSVEWYVTWVISPLACLFWKICARLSGILPTVFPAINWIGILYGDFIFFLNFVLAILIYNVYIWHFDKHGIFIMWIIKIFYNNHFNFFRWTYLKYMISYVCSLQVRKRKETLNPSVMTLYWELRYLHITDHKYKPGGSGYKFHDKILFYMNSQIRMPLIASCVSQMFHLYVSW